MLSIIKKNNNNKIEKRYTNAVDLGGRSHEGSTGSTGADDAVLGAAGGGSIVARQHVGIALGARAIVAGLRVVVALLALPGRLERLEPVLLVGHAQGERVVRLLGVVELGIVLVVLARRRIRRAAVCESINTSGMMTFCCLGENRSFCFSFGSFFFWF